MKVIMTPNLEPPHNLVKITPAYGGREFVGWTEARLVDWVIERNQQVGLIPLVQDGPHWVVDETELPDNDYFFDCWEWSDGVQVNMPKARIIHMDHIRRVRDGELAKLDVPFMRAVEAGDAVEQARIAAQKQALRDVPATFDLSLYTTPRTLKEAWPVDLPREN